MIYRSFIGDLQMNEDDLLNKIIGKWENHRKNVGKWKFAPLVNS